MRDTPRFFAQTFSLSSLYRDIASLIARLTLKSQTIDLRRPASVGYVTHDDTAYIRMVPSVKPNVTRTAVKPSPFGPAATADDGARRNEKRQMLWRQEIASRHLSVTASWNYPIQQRYCFPVQPSPTPVRACSETPLGIGRLQPNRLCGINAEFQCRRCRMFSCCTAYASNDALTAFKIGVSHS